MVEPATKLLSPLAKQIITAGKYDRLVVEGATPTKARELLANVTPDQLLAVPVKSLGHAYSMLCGLWLWHDALHECHEIAQADEHALHRDALNLHRERSKSSQNAYSVQSADIDEASFGPDIQTAIPSLNFWHAIMHRREGDFWNSKYWYAKCRNHPALSEIWVRAEQILGDSDHPLPRGGWDPGSFVDWVESLCAAGRGRDPLAVDLQRLEWTCLFEFSVLKAAGEQGGGSA